MIQLGIILIKSVKAQGPGIPGDGPDGGGRAGNVFGGGLGVVGGGGGGVGMTGRGWWGHVSSSRRNAWSVSPGGILFTSQCASSVVC